MDVPVQYFQAVIAVQLAIAGALLFQIRFFDSDPGAREQSGSDAWVRLAIAVVLVATLFGSLEAMREGWGRPAAILVTVGLAVSGVPILLRALPPLRRDAQTGPRHPHFPFTLLSLVVYAAVVGLIISID